MKFQETETRHGSKLYVLPMPHVRSVAVGVLVYAGTRDEYWPKEAGIAHALEHMVFKGNWRLPDSKAIAEEIEACGGSLNAFTCKEMTFFHRVVPDHAFKTAVESLTSQITLPIFRPEDIVSEMKNVTQEIRMRHDEPTGFCYRRFEELLFEGHPLQKTTLGTEEAVLGFDTAAFEHFHRSYYYPKNYVFIVVGNTTLADAEAALNATDLGSVFESRGRNERQTCTVSPVVTRRVFERDIKQAHLYMGVRIGASMDNETKSLDMFRTMIGGGMSFPLFQEVRDRRGLCYRISASITPWTDSGEFSLYIGTDPKRLTEAWQCIHEVMARAAEDPALFEKARNRTIGRNAVDFDNPVQVLRQAAFDILFEDAPKSPREIEDELRAETFADVRDAAVKHVLDRSRYVCACIAAPGTTLEFA